MCVYLYIYIHTHTHVYTAKNTVIPQMFNYDSVIHSYASTFSMSTITYTEHRLQ